MKKYVSLSVLEKASGKCLLFCSDAPTSQVIARLQKTGYKTNGLVIVRQGICVNDRREETI